MKYRIILKNGAEHVESITFEAQDEKDATISFERFLKHIVEHGFILMSLEPPDGVGGFIKIAIFKEMLDRVTFAVTGWEENSE